MKKDCPLKHMTSDEKVKNAVFVESLVRPTIDINSGVGDAQGNQVATKLPEHELQISRFQVQFKRQVSYPKTLYGKKERHVEIIPHWSGWQGNKKVYLEDEWVEENLHPRQLQRVRNRFEHKYDQHGNVDTSLNNTAMWLEIPIGAVRDDDPPEHLRCFKNYFYQGNEEKCLEGCIFNVMRFRYDVSNVDASDLQVVDVETKKLTAYLKTHVEKKYKGYQLKRVPAEPNVKWSLGKIFELDDYDPKVIRVGGKDKSKNHAVAICKGYVFDAASKWVLVKCRETLHWCAGRGGVE